MERGYERDYNPARTVMHGESFLQHQRDLHVSSSLARASAEQTSSNSANTPYAAASYSLWQKLAHVSLFSFPNAELEAAYHTYMERHFDVSSILFSGCILVTWMMFIAQYFMSPRDVRALLPHGWPMGVLHPLLALLLLSLQVTQPDIYIKHQKAVRAGILLIFMAVFGQNREVVLWFRLGRAGSISPEVSP